MKLMILNPCKFKLTKTVLSSFSPVMRIAKAKHAVLQVLRKIGRSRVPHVKMEVFAGKFSKFLVNFSSALKKRFLVFMP